MYLYIYIKPYMKSNKHNLFKAFSVFFLKYKG